MELLLVLKMFLFLGSISYFIGILSFIKRHMPKIKIQDTKKESKKDGRNETEE